ncbi:MAG: PD-(D/E)XK nuclease family protein [Clostridiales Family XIII bacterium]|jgi:ATP-dependent helicase/nuclease subunit B|nr:PD-(D/E)XK nuclease family protein [Clostridiales Family XIII bacterium]
MLHIYTARENVDKDGFIFGRVRDAMETRRVFLIVPEQSTLRAEADAFYYMDAPGFIDFDVLSMTSLGRRILADTGYAGANLSFISKYGKFMLLSRLMYRHGKEMRAFRRLTPSPDFVEKLNDMLAELKNHNVTPDELMEMASGIEADTILKNKLEDAALIYGGYEEAIGGRYMDQADNLKLYTSKIGHASFVPGSEFWFSGFDYLSPAVMDTVIELARCAASVNVVLTGDAGSLRYGGDDILGDPLFTLTNRLAAGLARRADEAGVGSALYPIPPDAADGYLRAMPPEIAHIERALFTRPHTPFVPDGETARDGSRGREASVASPWFFCTDAQCIRRPALRLIAAANYYAEAETAAAEICDLVRDGLGAHGDTDGEVRYRDILVLCNDMADRGRIIKRVFSRYGLPVFMDRRRSVEHNPVIEFLLTLPRIAALSRRYEDVFAMLKTGLTDISADETEELENYIFKYKIKGKRWDRDFTLGLKREDAGGHARGEYSQDELDALNESRRKVVSLVAKFEKGFKGGRTARERTDALLAFLTEDARLPGMIERYASELEERGLLEYASEMSGMWDVTEDILGQMSTVLGDIAMSMSEYATVLRTGLDAVRVGVLPTVVDQIVLGTMQRTRSGRAKAVFVLGANEGVLPASTADGAIFSEDEVYRLADAGRHIARTEETGHMEEELAIYRNLSKPGALLRVSYAASDSAGRNLSPSPVFERLRRIFPEVPVEKDIRNARVDRDIDPVPANVQYHDQTLDYLSENLRAYVNGGMLPEVWKGVTAWYRANMPYALHRVGAGLTFRGRHERVGAEFVDGLYRKVTSPSALERYSRCPFSWFVSYVLGLKERREAMMDSRNIGDVYHRVLMRFGRALSSDGLPSDDEMSRWRTITDDEIDETVRRLASEEYLALTAETGATEGDVADAAADAYRMGRVSGTAALAARVLTGQIREGRVNGIYFESAFGDGGDFPPITVSDGTGNGVRIEGRIDRVDIMDGGYARIVDYKSGTQEFSAPDAEAGYQMQLMLYLQAVSKRYEPAGVFYFTIKEPRVRDDVGVDVATGIMKEMKPYGVAVNDAPPLEAMGMDPKGRSTKDRMDKDQFDALRVTVSNLVESLIRDMTSGHVNAEPKTAVRLKTPAGRNMRACDYCHYKGICNYDPILHR